VRETTFSVAWRFGAVIVVAVLVLGVLNALPQFVGGEPLRVVRYASVQEAEARLHVRLYRPAAVPAGWTSRPAAVRLAVGRPDWAQFVFAAKDRDNAAALVLCQTLGDASDAARVASVLLPPGELLQSSTISIGGRETRLQRLLLDDGAIVHELWWRMGERRVMLRGRVAAESLPRIAQTIFGNQ
jgi:hypothetical protein